MAKTLEEAVNEEGTMIALAVPAMEKLLDKTRSFDLLLERVGERKGMLEALRCVEQGYRNNFGDSIEGKALRRVIEAFELIDEPGG